MKDLLSKLAIFFLAVVVILSSSFFDRAHVCKMDMVSKKNENSLAPFLKSNCCHNVIVFKYGKIFEEDHNVSIYLEQDDFKPILHLTSLYSLFVDSEIDKNYFKDYSPPLITRNIFLLVQRFQI